MTSIFLMQKGKATLFQNWMAHFVYVNQRQLLQAGQNGQGKMTTVWTTKIRNDEWGILMQLAICINLW